MTISVKQDYEATLEGARTMFRTFMKQLDLRARIVVLHDSDADGVTAGVVLQRSA
ncbi:MAG: hypothetical protein WKF84_29325 [Pyrinomonadaceae bacterium]